MNFSCRETIWLGFQRLMGILLPEDHDRQLDVPARDAPDQRQVHRRVHWLPAHARAHRPLGQRHDVALDPLELTAQIAVQIVWRRC
jgi:hypothetical protein